jgi:hypothetical protein
MRERRKKFNKNLKEVKLLYNYTNLLNINNDHIYNKFIKDFKPYRGGKKKPTYKIKELPGGVYKNYEPTFEHIETLSNINIDDFKNIFKEYETFLKEEIELKKYKRNYSIKLMLAVTLDKLKNDTSYRKLGNTYRIYYKDLFNIVKIVTIILAISKKHISWDNLNDQTIIKLFDIKTGKLFKM